MRGFGGQRLLCSPYFVVAGFILMSVVTVRYWSASSLNETLATKMQMLQTQLEKE